MRYTKTGVSAAHIAFTNWPSDMRLVSWSCGTTLLIKAGSAAWMIVLPMPRSANTTKYIQNLSALAASARNIAAAVTASETSTVLRRPHFPHTIPVGTDMRKNQMNIIDGRNPAMASLRPHSAFT